MWSGFSSEIETEKAEEAKDFLGQSHVERLLV